ncbi:MAG: extracellular matrix regulator RemB [Ignavibacteriales bacterium]
MLLHIGADVTVLLRDVVVILNAKRSLAESTREFLGNARHKGAVHSIADGAPKSIVVLDERVYQSPISSVTLAKRAGETGSVREIR